MASLIGPGDAELEVLTCYLKCAVQVLEEETLKQARTNLTAVKTNRAECEALANVYQAGVEKIATLVPMVLQCREAPSIVMPIEGVESLTWLLLSLAEIERCIHSGECYILSCAELLDSDIGNISMSRMIFSLVREFSFSLNLVQVAFTLSMCKRRRHQLQNVNLESADEWRDLATELLRYCPPAAFFEWCERRCRPVLKQCFLDLGQELWQFCALVAEAAYKDQGHFVHLGNNRKPDLASVLEELSVHPSDSLPLQIDYQDVHDQKYFGQGSFGTVFRCKWNEKDRVVKIIQLNPEVPALQQRFESEVSILASLRHPNAVQTFGFGYTDGRAQGFYVMEQMQADLSTIIRERKKLSGESLVFPIDVCMDVISQIVEGMCALRLQRVIHRDLKPANILVNRLDESMKPFERFYQVKLADFGTSKVRGGSHSMFNTRKVGTIAYMAPEVMSAPEESGDHGYSWKADVYSFGLVCSEILTGVVPFQEYLGHMGKTLAAVRGGERPDLPLDDGDPLRRLIEDCWKLNPEERPDVSEMRKRLWECRVFHFFMMKKPSTSWQTFCFRLDSRCEIESRAVSSPGPNKEGDQAAVSRYSSRGPLTALMQYVMNTAWSARSCKPVCLSLRDELSLIERNLEELVKLSMEPQRLCLADVERLRGCITRLGGGLRELVVLLHETAVGVHHCCSTSRLVELFSSEVSARIISLCDVTEFAGSRPGPAVMPTPEQVSAAMDRIQFDPHNVHVAVCGTSGSGISSFVNAFCDLGDEDHGAARVGVTQCTSEITRYRSHYPIGGNPFAAPLDGSLWCYDVPGAGTMAAPDGQYFNDQGLFVFDIIVLVYDVRFSRIDVEIFKNSIRFKIPVLIVRSKADQHIANMIRVETRIEPGDKKSYEKVYQWMADKYEEATRSEFQSRIAAMATDPEMDLQEQELLLKRRVYIVSSISHRPGDSRNKFIDESWLYEDLSTLHPRLHRLAHFHASSRKVVPEHHPWHHPWHHPIGFRRNWQWLQRYDQTN